mmetsp:Transcript_28319/g.82026  ORF Transcript_28319/g.82026 Transcript_28319/m.82026 type:complete len:221 (-) Transcript_28319:2877-3539(-)
MNMSPPHMLRVTKLSAPSNDRPVSQKSCRHGCSIRRSRPWENASERMWQPSRRKHPRKKLLRRSVPGLRASNGNWRWTSAGYKQRPRRVWQNKEISSMRNRWPSARDLEPSEGANARVVKPISSKSRLARVAIWSRWMLTSLRWGPRRRRHEPRLIVWTPNNGELPWPSCHSSWRPNWKEPASVKWKSRQRCGRSMPRRRKKRAKPSGSAERFRSMSVSW